MDSCQDKLSTEKAILFYRKFIKGEIHATFHREAKPLSENILDLRLVKKE